MRTATELGSRLFLHRHNHSIYCHVENLFYEMTRTNDHMLGSSHVSYHGETFTYPIAVIPSPMDVRSLLPQPSRRFVGDHVDWHDLIEEVQDTFPIIDPMRQGRHKEGEHHPSDEYPSSC